MAREMYEEDVVIGKKAAAAHDDDDGAAGVEVNTGEGEPIEITVVDDTPESDRGRKKLNKDVLAEDDDDEAEKYGEKVKKRISEMKHAVHDERRAREAAERRAEEAERVAAESLRRAQHVQQQLTFGEANYATDTVQAAKQRVEAAKAKYRKAYDAGDPDAVADAAQELSSATTQESQAVAWASRAKQNLERGTLQTENRGVDSTQQHRSQQQSAPVVDEKAAEWQIDNPWFNQDPEMTAAAWGVHERLTRVERIDPIRDADKYYKELNATMRRRFPEYEWDDDESSGDGAAPAKKPTKKTATSAVAPVKRVSTGNPNPNKVVLTRTQVALAERLGLTLEQYARELVKTNGAQS